MSEFRGICICFELSVWLTRAAQLKTLSQCGENKKGAHEAIAECMTGLVFTTAIVSLNIPEIGLFADFVKRLKNDTCFHW